MITKCSLIKKIILNHMKNLDRLLGMDTMPQLQGLE